MTREAASFLEEIRAFRGRPELVRIGRHGVEDDAVYSSGYVLDVSERLVLLHSVSDRIDLDGFEVLRLRDVTAFQTEWETKRFYQRALELKGQRPGDAGAIHLADMREAVRSANDAHPMLAIHREALYPGECVIGRVRALLKTGFRLHYITPAAEWEEDPTFYRYSDVTRLGFGGEYENTLALVAAEGGHALPAPLREI